MFVFHWFLLVFGTPGELWSLGEAGESKILGFPEPGGGWGIENPRFSLVFQGFGRRGGVGGKKKN